MKGRTSDKIKQLKVNMMRKIKESYEKAVKEGTVIYRKI